MKKFTSKFIAVVILITVMSLTANAQTNVSGGIYANTTWTLANSPYIVVDTVVVFPGVTLTIEPGVVVKFEDDKRLEIRNATILAEGTSTDSITFTSNSALPVTGIWGDVYLNQPVAQSFNYCNFQYADYGIKMNQGGADTLFIRNSYFLQNTEGVWGAQWYYIWIDSCCFKNNTYGVHYIAEGHVRNTTIIDNQIGLFGMGAGGVVDVTNCIVKYNQIGVHAYTKVCVKNCIIDSNSMSGIHLVQNGDSVRDCIIRYNGIGIQIIAFPTNLITRNVIEYNNIGINMNHGNNWIYCNKICNDTTYDFYLNTSDPQDISNNYWCTTDSVIIASKIYDGYDDVNLGLVTFMPVDTDSCYLTGCNLSITSTVTNATCDTCHNGSAMAVVGNGFAPYVYTCYTAPIQTTQTATGLSAGNYIICVTDANGCTACSSVFIDSSNCTGFAINANSNNSTCSTCNDGYAWVTVAGGTAPYFYTWYTTPMQSGDTATGLLPGTYAVCVTDLYGCSACDTVVVSTGNCSAHFNLYPDTVPHNYVAVNMASGVAPLSYSWNWGDGSPNDTSPFPNHTYAAAGFYTICLTITDAVGCTNTYCNSFYLQKTSNTMVYVTVVAQTSLGINEAARDELVLIYPNPVTDNKLHIVFEKNTASDFTLELLDVSGRKVFTQKLPGAKSQTVTLPYLANGIYHAVIKGSNESYNQKVVVLGK